MKTKQCLHDLNTNDMSLTEDTKPDQTIQNLVKKLNTVEQYSTW